MARFLRRYGTLLGFVLILVFFSLRLPGTFLTAQNWLNITQQLSMLLVVAAGMTVVMVMGDFDLSVGSMASLSGVVVAVLFAAGWPIWAAILAALLVGLAGGVINASVASSFTLAMGQAWLTVCRQAQTKSLPMLDGRFDPAGVRQLFEAEMAKRLPKIRTSA